MLQYGFVVSAHFSTLQKQVGSKLLHLLRYSFFNMFSITALGTLIFIVLQQKRIVPALVTYVVDLLFGEIIKKKNTNSSVRFPTFFLQVHKATGVIEKLKNMSGEI